MVDKKIANARIFFRLVRKPKLIIKADFSTLLLALYLLPFPLRCPHDMESHGESGAVLSGREMKANELAGFGS